MLRDIYIYICSSLSHGHVTRCVWYCVTTSLASRARLRGITKLISLGSVSVVVEHWTSNGGVEGSILAVGKCFFCISVFSISSLINPGINFLKYYCGRQSLNFFFRAPKKNRAD